ncbi:unnamed protein product [Victoria cruziana]
MKNSTDEDEEEQFFESFDRIPSTSGSETDEDDHHQRGQHTRHQLAQSPPIDPNPIATMAVSNYQVWISEPESIKERRQRLLQQMGLGNDKGLLRAASGSFRGREPVSSLPHSSSSSSSSSCDESSDLPSLRQQCSTSGEPNSTQLQAGFARSNPSEGFPGQRESRDLPASSSSIGRSSSDDTAIAADHTPERHLNNATATDTNHRGRLPPVPFAPLEHPHDRQLKGDFLLDDRPSFSGHPRKSTEGPVNQHHRPPRVESSSGRVDELSSLEYEDEEAIKEQICKIKNLDNGKEFIVNEFGEDGMWNKLKEVETGRQLTIEEFEMTVGHSPIVQELMRRECESADKKEDPEFTNGKVGLKVKKKGGWLRSIKVVANTVTGHKERRSSDEKDTSSEKGGRRSSSATDDSQDVGFFSPERTKVRQYGKSCKELTALYMSQEIQAHTGSIWSMKFSLDGKYLASAGEDCVIHVWQVMESEKKGEILIEKAEENSLHPSSSANASPEPSLMPSSMESNIEKKRRGKGSGHKKNSDHIVLPENVFLLSEKPVCSFHGHLEDVLDLSWSKSQYLLSSSMDKTVRLWHMSSNSCLKMFSHSDYVTCIQFNPVDDRYFISGSLDAKVRLWSIPDRQVVDWSDLHEMVTAACYTPDGQGAFVGSHKGSCRIFKTSGNKLQQEKQIDILSKKRKSNGKKITGFQFAPGSASAVLITSADSRIRIYDGVDLVHKYKGFRNTSSQIAASFTATGKYVICASEDSHVFLWRHDLDSGGPTASSRNKGSITRSYEHFFCRDVSVAIPWPGKLNGPAANEPPRNSSLENVQPAISSRSRGSSFPLLHIPPRLPAFLGSGGGLRSPMQSNGQEVPMTGNQSEAPNNTLLPSPRSPVPASNAFSDSKGGTATWPEEKLTVYDKHGSPARHSRTWEGNDGKQVQIGKSTAAAWGMVIVTAGLDGEIKAFQNFGLPLRI